MHKTLSEAEELVLAIKEHLPRTEYEVVVCPPFTALERVKKVLEGTPIRLGAQNMYFEEKGAFTGEISPVMLKDIGVEYVIIGHSERRHIFGETDEMISKKVLKALEHNLIPILCVGEKLDEREDGKTEVVVERQLMSAVGNLDPADIRKVVIAYEPVWAIGTGRNATPQQAQEVHKFIRTKLAEKFGEEIASSVTILYGGSVKPHNVYELTKEEDVDGALVGGASLSAESFIGIIKNAWESQK